MTPRQQRVLERLQDAYEAMSPRHHWSEDKIVSDETFPEDFKDFARAVRAADRAGLLNNPAVQAEPSVRAARDSLTTLNDRRRRLRRQTAKGSEAGKRRLWSKFENWLAKQANELRKEKCRQKEIRRALVEGLRCKATEDATALANHLEEMTQQAWNKRFRSLCDD